MNPNPYQSPVAIDVEQSTLLWTLLEFTAAAALGASLFIAQPVWAFIWTRECFKYLYNHEITRFGFAWRIVLINAVHIAWCFAVASWLGEFYST